MSDQPTADEQPPMQVQVTRHFTANYGDSGGVATTAHTYDPDERVEDLLFRVLDLPLTRWMRFDPTEYVTLQVVSGTEPVTSDRNERTDHATH